VVLTTDQKGTVAETAIVFAAVKLGIDLYRPIGEGGRYDMVFDIGQRLLRVQCKYAPLKDDVVLIRCRRARRTADGLLQRGYTAEEIDAFAAYCPDLDRSFFLPIERCRRRLAIQLRVSPPRNNQGTDIEWADDFDFRGYTGAAWGRSSAGRAPEWHSGGHGFDPRRLHLRALGSPGALFVGPATAAPARPSASPRRRFRTR